MRLGEASGLKTRPAGFLVMIFYYKLSDQTDHHINFLWELFRPKL